MLANQPPCLAPSGNDYRCSQPQLAYTQYAFFLWFGLEGAAASHFLPVYSYSTNPISDLDIPYIFEDAKHGNRVSQSIRASLMNANF